MKKLIATTLALTAFGAFADDAALIAETKKTALSIPPKLKLGEQIDGLAITAVVADNGINLVYQARDPATQKLYALKTL